MTEKGQRFEDTSFDSVEHLKEGGYKVSVTVPDSFTSVIADLALRNNSEPRESIVDLLTQGVWFLKHPDDGGQGGLAYFKDEQAGKIIAFATHEMGDVLLSFYPNIPSTEIPDPLLQNPYKENSGE